MTRQPTDQNLCAEVLWRKNSLSLGTIRDPDGGTPLGSSTSVSAPFLIPPAPVPAPRLRGMGWIVFLLWFAPISTLAYWVIWFFVDRSWLATTDTPEYYAFENAFPLADAWIGLTSLAGAWAMLRRKPTVLLWMLVAGSASIYLGALDVLFDLENGIYAGFPKDPVGVLTELAINTLTLVGGGAVIRFAWKHRVHFWGWQGANAGETPNATAGR